MKYFTAHILSLVGLAGAIVAFFYPKLPDLVYMHTSFSGVHGNIDHKSNMFFGMGFIILLAILFFAVFVEASKIDLGFSTKENSISELNSKRKGVFVFSSLILFICTLVTCHSVATNLKGYNFLLIYIFSVLYWLIPFVIGTFRKNWL